MINIERAILCSLLESIHLSGTDRSILTKTINANVFTGKERNIFAKSIIRLRELGEPIDSDTVRLKLISVNKWSFALEEEMLKIMTQTPFSLGSIFDKYYKLLEDRHEKQHKKRAALFI